MYVIDKFMNNLTLFSYKSHILEIRKKRSCIVESITYSEKNLM